MPTITILPTNQQVTVTVGTRLVNAIEDAGVAIGHRCGGQSKCTTCRVAIQAGEPSTMTEHEHNKLKEREFLGQYRLSCQIVVEHDMTVTPQMTLQSVPDWSDTGPRCADMVEPEAQFVDKSQFLK
ncbi:MAG: (2Fe-2S)-binding protein [Chloroflexia bacterium]|nr:(2Fe-2S)-binding protein [Chloroflexia bacterium]